MLASASPITPSNQALRWLISSGETPTPGRDTSSRRASSSTATGSVAGPAEKFTTRSVTPRWYRRARSRGGDMAYKRIVHGTDGSASSARAAHVAAAITVANNGELIVAHVQSPGDAEAERTLAAAVAACEAAGVKARKLTAELLEGRPAEAMVEFAEQRDAGLVVVSGGRGQ